MEIGRSFKSTDVTFSVLAKSTEPRMGLLAPPWWTGKGTLDLWFETLRTTPPDLECFANSSRHCLCGLGVESGTFGGSWTSNRYSYPLRGSAV